MQTHFIFRHKKSHQQVQDGWHRAGLSCWLLPPLLLLRLRQEQVCGDSEEAEHQETSAEDEADTETRARDQPTRAEDSEIRGGAPGEQAG